MTSTTAPAPRYSTVTVPADAKVRISAQTASRDFTAAVVPGTYAVEYTDVNYRPVADAERAYYVIARVEIDTPTRTQSSAEFGGVALAWEDIAGERQPHTMVWYSYEVKDAAIGRYTFA